MKLDVALFRITVSLVHISPTRIKLNLKNKKDNYQVRTYIYIISFNAIGVTY